MTIEDNEDQLSLDELEEIMKRKYKMVYSERLGRKVYVLKKWVDKPVFKRHKKLFGYTDIGWTVKHPKQLIRVLLIEGIWDKTDTE
ncbi:MAG: hypothetical protein INQ03_06410 [Candidatus Heimdallarchaeota archaeon]|nr:hypothetical protein [Candidatus Heimdallarchaeota archaeon]